MTTVLVPILRAAAQSLVGLIVAALITAGIPVSDEVQGAILLALTAILTGVVAKAQQFLEQRYPFLGAILMTPNYGTPPANDPSPLTATSAAHDDPGQAGDLTDVTDPEPAAREHTDGTDNTPEQVPTDAPEVTPADEVNPPEAAPKVPEGGPYSGS